MKQTPTSLIAFGLIFIITPVIWGINKLCFNGNDTTMLILAILEFIGISCIYLAVISLSQNPKGSIKNLESETYRLRDSLIRSKTPRRRLRFSFYPKVRESITPPSNTVRVWMSPQNRAFSFPEYLKS